MRLLRLLAPKDLVAIMCLLFAFWYKAAGHNGALDSTITLILGYYFVKRQYGDDKGL